MFAPLFSMSFLFLDVPQSCEFITRWKPQHVADNLVSVTGVHEYVKARLGLQSDCIGTLFHPNTDVVFVLGGRRDDLSVGLKYILAQDKTKKVDACRELRKWMPEHMTINTSSLSEADLAVWDNSE